MPAVLIRQLVVSIIWRIIRGQKYIILLSDGGDSSKSAQAALDAYDLGIRIFALSIGNDSKQMQTVAANSNGIYLNSPTAEQINEMMQQFAAEVLIRQARTFHLK